MMLPAVSSAESFGPDFVDTPEEESVEGCFLDICHSHCSNKEYEFNHFFISAETSLQQKSRETVLDRGQTIDDGNAPLVSELNYAPELNDNHVKSVDFGIFHGILESDDLDILPSARTHLEFPAGTHDNGPDSLPESDDGADDAEKKVSSLSNDEVMNAETEHLKTELELIEKLDSKLQQLESTEPSTCSSRHHLSAEGCKTIPTAVAYLRKKRKIW